MKNKLILFVSLIPIFVFLGIMGAFFKEDIYRLIKLCKTDLSSIIIEADVQILLYLGVIGLVGIFRIRSYKK